VVVKAVKRALEEIEAEGWETYGDYHRAVIDHPFGDQLEGLNYPQYAVGGSEWSINSYSRRRRFGTSFRQVVDLDSDTFQTILAGGNSGSPFSEHYDDQLREWVDGKYRDASGQPADEVDITVEATDE
jgi:penicillin amidase